MTTLNKFKRLALARLEFPKIVKDEKGFGYLYAKLEQILDSIIPILNKFELDILQTIKDDKVKTYFVDLITGDAELLGEILIDRTIVLPKMNPYQVYGSAISYFRRYQILVGLGLAQEDNDAGGAIVQDKPRINNVDKDTSVTKESVAKLYKEKEHLVPDDWKNQITAALLENKPDRLARLEKYLKELNKPIEEVEKDATT